jgi:hypothetical protein
MMVVGITPPLEVNGVPQDPIDGVSFAYSFDDPKAKGQLLTQYFEIMKAVQSTTMAGWPQLLDRIPWVPGSASRYSRVDAGQGCLGALQPGGRLEPGKRSRRKDAGKAGPIEGNLSH